MIRKAGLLTVVAVTVLLGAAVPAFADETLTLDTYSTNFPPNTYSGPVTTSLPLAPNTYYLTTIQGTFSLWSPLTWNTPGGCGTPEATPMFPSTGTATTGPVGLDADTVFAATKGSHFCNGPLPTNSQQLQINTGSGWGYVAPEGGPHTSPTPTHSYTYLLSGSGQNASFGFRVYDYPTADDYGSLKITVHAATKDDCRNGGWQQFGAFKNQGDCVSSIATQGKNQPAGNKYE